MNSVDSPCRDRHAIERDDVTGCRDRSRRTLVEHDDHHLVLRELLQDVTHATACAFRQSLFIDSHRCNAFEFLSYMQIEHKEALQ